MSAPQLISQVAEQTSTLVRDEMQLAKVELRETVKNAGIGAGLFGTAGVVALYAGWAAVFTVIYALALVMDVWLAALIVTVVLTAIAALAALVGRSKVQQATPPVEATQRSVQRDIETVKERKSR
ncbi:phage holin family protein [Nocardioides rotundus]|nr:phage holin family protein [Nocardioides rotundus]